MAYSENIKMLAVSLCQNGQSPEDVARLFSMQLGDGLEKGYPFLKRLAESKGLAFSEIDWQELNDSLPEGKTIRNWCSQHDRKENNRKPVNSPQALRNTNTVIGLRDSVNPFWKEKHRRTLLKAVIPNLNALAVFPVDDNIQERLFHWWLTGPDADVFAFPGNDVKLEMDGWKINVCLPVEHKIEWRYLLQHLPGDPLARIVTNWKKAIVRDINARCLLFKYVRDQIRDETQLPFLADFPVDRDKYGFTWHLVYDIYKFMFSLALDMGATWVGKHDFDNSEPVVVKYGFWRVGFFCADKNKREEIIKCVAKTEFSDPPQAEAAKRAYLAAQKKTQELKAHIDEIRMKLDFPEGSSCDACRSQVENESGKNL